MQYPNLFKRIIPFGLTLMLGLFIASFFVSLAPSMDVGRGRFPHQMRVEYRDLKLENERLKTENEELKERVLNCKEWDFKKFDLYRENEAPPPPPQLKLEKRLKEKLERLEAR